MTTYRGQRLFYWEDPRFTLDTNERVRLLPPGEDLAALRRGLNHDPGTVPAMWKFYATWQDGEKPWRLVAEHHSLTLFAVHQQSQSYFVHRKGTHVGKIVRALHDKFEPAAVDRRFFAAVTASDIEELAYHLRGLLRQTHSLSISASFDYTALWRDLASWGLPDRRRQAQRRWGLAYCGSSGSEEPVTTTANSGGNQ